MSREIAVIASLFPAPFNAKRPGFHPQPYYEIKACKDLAQPEWCEVLMQEEKPYMGLDRTGFTTWPADQVADDLINSWAGGALGRNDSEGAIPAIWRSEGAKKVNGVWVIPQHEIDFHRQQQDGVLNRLVQMARIFHQSKVDPLPVMRDAAVFLKISGEEWQHEMTSDARFECPYCKAVNKNGAAVCQNCNNVINQVEFERIRAMIQRAENSLEGLPDDEVAPQPRSRRATANANKDKEAEVVPA